MVYRRTAVTGGVGHIEKAFCYSTHLRDSEDISGQRFEALGATFINA
jgi:hypothetical protein